MKGGVPQRGGTPLAEFPQGVCVCVFSSHSPHGERGVYDLLVNGHCVLNMISDKDQVSSSPTHHALSLDQVSLDSPNLGAVLSWYFLSNPPNAPVRDSETQSQAGRRPCGGRIFLKNKWRIEDADRDRWSIYTSKKNFFLQQIIIFNRNVSKMKNNWYHIM